MVLVNVVIKDSLDKSSCDVDEASILCGDDAVKVGEVPDMGEGKKAREGVIRFVNGE